MPAVAAARGGPRRIFELRSWSDRGLRRVSIHRSDTNTLAPLVPLAYRSRRVKLLILSSMPLPAVIRPSQSLEMTDANSAFSNARDSVDTLHSRIRIAVDRHLHAAEDFCHDLDAFHHECELETEFSDQAIERLRGELFRIAARFYDQSSFGGEPALLSGVGFRHQLLQRTEVCLREVGDVIRTFADPESFLQSIRQSILSLHAEVAQTIPQVALIGQEATAIYQSAIDTMLLQSVSLGLIHNRDMMPA